MNKITYHKEGDYLIPNLAIKGAESDYYIGLYGRLKLEYMKKHSLGLYSDLILSGTLPEYLIEIDKTANEREKSIINELAKEEKVDENLKQNNQLEWVRCMNNIKNRAEEIVLNELIYCSIKILKGLILVLASTEFVHTRFSYFQILCNGTSPNPFYKILNVRRIIMINFREVNEDDILKEWYDCMESTYLCYTNEQDREHEFKFDSLREKILKNVSKQNKKYVKSNLI